VPTQEHLDHALDRLHQWGPEFNGRLSNHGPMVVEAMVRRGHADQVDQWLDDYEERLEPAPTPHHQIVADEWSSALGDPSRLGDWISYFENELADAPWEEVLVHWWPRLLPGMAASATHSVIRVGHNVRTLRELGTSELRLQEFARALAYWAGRWLPVPGELTTNDGPEPAMALARLPALGSEGTFPDLLQTLGRHPQWPACASAQLTETHELVEPQLKSLVSATTLHYASHGHGEPIMLVHAATAPNAVLRVLPSLPHDLWPVSLKAAWAAAAAITTLYNPTDPTPVDRTPRVTDTEEVFARAVENGDEHVIKLADTALDANSWATNRALLDAALAACEWIEQE
jgi:hypothetical protein